jgi:hypothetical protein
MFVMLAVPVVTAGAAHAGTHRADRRDSEAERCGVSPPVCRDLDRGCVSGKVAANLSVWYDIELKDQEGEKWLKDIRQWWRRTGRDAQHADGRRLQPHQGPGRQQGHIPV